MNALNPDQLMSGLPPSGEDAPLPEWVRYWRAINRYKVGIVLFVVAVGVLASVYAFSLRPVYRGTATVMLEAGKKKSVTNEEMYEAMVGTPRDYYLTQIEVMKSRENAERLVRTLGLTRHPEYDPRRQQEKGWMAALLEQIRPGTPQTAPSDEDLVEGVVGAIMGQLSFQPVRNTQLVKISFDSHDPVLAERVPNTIAMIYIVSDLEARAQASRQSTDFLAAQADELKKKLADSERDLQQYRESQRIVVAKGMSLSDATRRLEELNTSLDDARRKRSEAEQVYKQVSAAAQSHSPDAMESLAVLQKNPVLLRLKEAEADAERKFSDASRRYGPEHPKMVTAQADYKAAQDAVKRQMATVVQAVAKEYESARAQEASLEQAHSRAKADAQVFNRAEFPLARLERDVDSNRRLYEAFLQRAKETRIGDMQQAIARVIDPSLTPKSASGPNVRQIIAMSMLGALLFAVSIALLLERLDNKLRTSHDLETRLDLKAVGVLPRMQTSDAAPLERIVVDDNANTFSEAIRTIRSDVQLSTVDAPKKTVLVTSTVPNEGKTTVACNLALAFAQVKKTLFIEADMRRPRISRLLGLDKGHAGLSEFVAGNMSIDQCIQAVNGSTLRVLQSGKIPLNPLEMLSSQRFVDALQSLQDEFDVIVIDSPPMQLVSDAMVLSRLATAVLFVVKADDTPSPLIRQCITRMRRINAPLLGAVLNQFDVERAQRYYGYYSGIEAHYYRGYGARYGYGYYGRKSGERTTSAAAANNRGVA